MNTNTTTTTNTTTATVYTMNRVIESALRNTATTATPYETLCRGYITAKLTAAGYGETMTDTEYVTAYHIAHDTIAEVVRAIAATIKTRA